MRLGSIAPPSELAEGDLSVNSSGNSIPKAFGPLGNTTPGNEKSGSSRCLVNHFATGFEGQTVYGWKGEFKGRLGVVVRTSGKSVRLSVDSAMSRESLLDIPGDCLMAYVDHFN